VFVALGAADWVDGLAWLSAAGLLLIALALRSPTPRAVVTPSKRDWREGFTVQGALVFVGIVSGVVLLTKGNLLYPRLLWATSAMTSLVLCALILGVGALVLPLRRASLAKRLLLVAMVAAMTAKCMVPIASPSPHVDVWTIAEEAVSRLLAGRNPYTEAYPDIYAGAFAYEPRLTYPPGYVLAIVPARLIFGDVRWASVLSEGVSLWLIVRFFGKERGLWAAWAWALFPTSLLMIEQAWVDLFLVPLQLGALLMLRQGQIKRAGIALGVAATIKQFGLGLVLFAALWTWRRYGWRAALALCVSAAGMLSAIVLPFAFWDGHGLWLGVAGNILSFAPRVDAVSWSGYALRHGLPGLPQSLAALCALGALLLGARLALRRESTAWLVGGALFFLVTFLFAKQAFCNYYTWVASLLFVALAPDDIAPDDIAPDDIAPDDSVSRAQTRRLRSPPTA
jgi:Glycosyltransferase family 87